MIDGKQFEFEVQELLRLMGLNASVTGYSQDGGIDLRVENTEPIFSGKYVVQCKAQQKPVGEPVLRDLFGTMHAERASKGILITTSSFTSAARRFAEGKPIELIDGDKYRQLCEEYGVASLMEDSSQAAVPDELLQAGSKFVRILKFECTDPTINKEIREYVFCIGTVSINQDIVFIKIGKGGFEFGGGYKVNILERRANFGNGLDWAKISIVCKYESYYLTVEGQSATIEAFAPLISKETPKPSGCLLLLIFQIALIFTCFLLIFHLL